MSTKVSKQQENKTEEVIEKVDEVIETIEETIEQNPTIAEEKPGFFKRVGNFIGDKTNKAKTWVKENPGKTAVIVTVAAVATKVALDKASSSKTTIDADFVELDLKPQLEYNETEQEHYVSEESYEDSHYDDYETVVEQVTEQVIEQPTEEE